MQRALGKSLIWGGALCLAVVAHAGAFLVLDFGAKSVSEQASVEYEIILPPLGSLDAPVKEEKSKAEAKTQSKPKPKPQLKPELKPKPKPKPRSNPDPIVPIEETETQPVTEVVKVRPTLPDSSSDALSQEDMSLTSDTQTTPSALNQSQSDTPVSSEANFGVSSGVIEGQENFAGTLQAWLLKHKRYPHRARARRMQGVVQVWFRLDEEGNLLEARIAESSGHKVLDQATLNLLKRVSPFPKPPLELRRTDLTFVVPVAYRLN